MVIKCLGSSSKGNCYILEKDDGIIILEAGISPKEVLRAIDYDLKKVIGVFVTHEHLDHSKYIKEWLAKGVKVFATAGTFNALGISHHNITILKSNALTLMKTFSIRTFSAYHDVAEPIGFLFSWFADEFSIVFITDTYKVPYKFSNVNVFMIEANYSKKLLLNSDNVYAKRVITSHLPIDETIKFLERSVDKKTERIMLLHLSDKHSDATEFKQLVERTVGIPTIIADKNIKIETGLIK
jgi:phosphoribosyl 1,2-cyclic phosphodiesterase